MPRFRVSSDVHRRGYTRKDVVVCIACFVFLSALIVPSIVKFAGVAKERQACAANLQRLGAAAIFYTQTGKSSVFPRLSFVPDEPPKVYSAAYEQNPFSQNGPGPNDVSGALFHLVKVMQVPPSSLICPGDDADPIHANDITPLSNFVYGRGNLSYSYSNAYPSRNAVVQGWYFHSQDFSSSEAPLMSDMNPGDHSDGGPSKVAYNSPSSEMRRANSFNHGTAGQNVLYSDGHVAWAANPFAGRTKKNRVYRDNIFTSSRSADEQNGRGGDIYAPPHDGYDYVLLPTRNDRPGKPLPTSQSAK